MFIRFIRNLKILPRWVIILIDLAFIAFSCLLAYLLRFNFDTDDVLNYHYWQGILLYTASGFFSILITNSYKGIIRYTGLEDGTRIFYMVILNMVMVSFLNLIIFYKVSYNVIPYSVVLITFLSSFLFLFNYRLLVKYIFTYYKQSLFKKKRVIVFGAGQTGIITKHVVNSTPRMQVIGFLEDDLNKAGKVLDGVKIYNAKNIRLEGYLKELNVDELIITVKDMSIDWKNELVDICIKNQVKVRTIPPVEKWVKGELSLNQIKEVNIEDLLGREAIRLGIENVERELAGKRILITGAAGSIGGELVRQVILYNPEVVIMLDQAESALYEIEREVRGIVGVRCQIVPYLADITNRDRIRFVMEEYQPDIIFHAAAYKHVPMMEGNPSEAIQCNIIGTKILADFAVDLKVEKFVMISTDKAVNPTNVMGCSKRIAEIYVQSLNNHLEAGSSQHTSFVTTRFGNVLGSNGSVIPLFRNQIQNGGPITVTHPEITRYFMTIPEACQLVLEAGTMGNGGEIFIFDMGKSLKILDLAKKMILLSGFEPEKDIEIVFTGLREGEKLYEELLNTKENTIPTHHNKILIARVREYKYTDINKLVDLFNELVYDRNELKMVALMKELVPEFKSNYSKYEILDSQAAKEA